MTAGTPVTPSFLYLPGAWVWVQGDSLVRAYWWGKLRPGMRMVMAAPGWHGLALVEKHAIERLGAEAVIPWGSLTPRFAGGLLEAIMALSPDYLSIFTPMLHALLAECRRRRVEPREAFRSLKYLMVVGLHLFPHFRERLLSELGVVDIYENLGNPEGLRAMECSYHRGHHIFLDLNYVEIIDSKTPQPLPPGRRGRVVLTFLVPHGSIYIRYDTGDIGEVFPQPCPCGRTWPLMEVYDRAANAFLVQGQELFPYDVGLCLDSVPELCGLPYAVIRREGGMPYLRLLLSRPAGTRIQRLESRAVATLGERLGIDTRVEWVEGLPLRWRGRTVIEEKEWEGWGG